MAEDGRLKPIYRGPRSLLFSAEDVEKRRKREWVALQKRVARFPQDAAS